MSTGHLHVFLSQGSCLNPEDIQLNSTHAPKMYTFSMQIALHYLSSIVALCSQGDPLRDKTDCQH